MTHGPVARVRDPYLTAGLLCAPFVAVSVLDGFWKTRLLSGPLLRYWAFDFVKWIVLPVLLVAILHRLTALRARDYGFASPTGTADHLYVFPMPFFSLLFAHLIVFQVAQRMLDYPRPYFEFKTALDAVGALGAVYAAATAGFWESVFYIGLPWLWLTRSIDPSNAFMRRFALLSAIVFAAAHWEQGMPGVASAFTFQAIAVWWYFRLRTLWPIVAAHIAIDLVYFW